MKLQSVAVHPAVCREGTQQPGRSLPVSTAHLPAHWVHPESPPKAQPRLGRWQMTWQQQPTAGTLWPPLWPCDNLFGLILKPLWRWNHWCHTWAEPELRNSSFLFCFSFLFACRAPAKQIPGSKFGMDRCEKRHNLVREINFEDNHSAWLTKNPPTGHNTLWDNRDTFYCLLKQGVFWSPGSCDWCGFCSHANKAFNRLL